ncbi:hypothetical protein OSB04_031321 [Centaurea solstitialis]|uniref:Retrovirus-related Pol polyprotein from transposon TNT 1-94 n=1 Tax=Centaurea solstitialis TaxID=347529 RepID=A0AA38SA42_9ASTR|nr:hypothetical protein OSB04_031321 [Centaurea solstitialis]
MKKYNLSEVSPMRTSMGTVQGLEWSFSGVGMIGSLLYLTASRPDIMFATCLCASAVKRILRYLKETPTLGLWYPLFSEFALLAYTNSDYGGCQVDRKSTSGSCQFLRGKLVSWSSKKQNCVSTSTAKAEYVAAANCCSQALWMQTQLRDYGYTFNKIPILCNSESAIAISANLVQHSKTKHIDIRYHFPKHHVEEGNVEMYFVNTEFQLADLFTKALDEKRFNILVEKFGIFLTSLWIFKCLGTCISCFKHWFDHYQSNLNDQVVNQSQDLSSYAVSFLQHRYDRIVLVKKPNNYYLVPGDGFPEYTIPLIEVLCNHSLFYALAPKKEVLETYLFYAHVCNLENEGLTIMRYVTHPKRRSMVPLQMTINDLQLALQLEEKSEVMISPLQQCLKKHQDVNQPNLILQRFFGLIFAEKIAAKLPTEKLTSAKLFPINKFKPTLHDKGYRSPRPLSKKLLQYLFERDRMECIRKERTPEPVPVTPLHIRANIGERLIDESPEGELEVAEVPNEKNEGVDLEIDRSPPPQQPKKAKKSKRKATEVVIQQSPEPL